MQQDTFRPAAMQASVGHGIRVYLQTITPALARTLLAANVDNRALRPNVVKAYKEQFLRGEYVTTHQGIAFCVDGTLLDGQHRLSAIAEMPDDWSAPMIVTTGLPRKANAAIDRGVGRTVGDIMRVPQGLAAVARHLAEVVESRTTAISAPFLRPYVAGVSEPYERLIAFAPRASKTWSSAPVRAAAVLRMLRDKRNEQYVLDNYHAMVSSQYDRMCPLVQALRRQHDTGKVNRLSDVFVRAYYALDARRSGQDTLMIREPSRVFEEIRDDVRTLVLPAPQPTANQDHKPDARKAEGGKKF